MKTILDPETRDELIRRVSSISEQSKPLWGKMTAGQMLRHCSKWDEMAQGKVKYRQWFLGKLLGKMALKDMLKDEPLKKNLPTVPSFKIASSPDIAAEKEKWLQLLAGYARDFNDGFIHPFFGYLTREQAGYLVYKHANHHLRQFNS